MARSMEENSRKWTAPVLMKSGEVFCPSTCVTLGPIYNESESKLIIGTGGHRGMNMKLRVFKDVDQDEECTLAESPTAIMHFVNEARAVPTIAVAAGSSLLVYKNMKPFYKFTVPSSPIIPTELEAWKAAASNKINPNTLSTVLERLVTDVSFSKLTPMSQTYILSKSNEDKLALIEKIGGKILNSGTITCIAKLTKSAADIMDILVFGTEHCDVFLIDGQAFTIIQQIKLQSVPVTIRTYGYFDVDYRIFVHTRDSLIFSIKRNDTEYKPIIVSQSMITSMILHNKSIVYTTTEDHITFCNFKGKKTGRAKCKDKVKMIEPFYYETKQLSAVIAVFDKELRMYNDSYLLDVTKFQKPLAWVKYGCYGREDSSLIVCFKDGTLGIQIFRRTANFDIRKDFNEVPPAHALKLQIPKKTKIFIDQTQRELEFSSKIHNAYQKHLFNMKFKVAESYLALASSATSSVSTTSSLPIEIAVDINGFGPTHRMTVRLLSSSRQNLYDMQISIICDPEVYEFETPLMMVPILTPGHAYTYTTLLTCKDPERATTSEVRALLIHEKRATPIVTAVIKMPFSEFPLD
ncbi:hypothetical protein GCK72_001475 [Caenorhabditis remanei]|uniref:Uncharacterized protein n=1 Tax=Caenorhabditis remanei TaxID=31234 RepID=A0A6A5HP21_CAERE|nr:hypothetical protein GCK72_001475 [Caenorhabditis remanei]KAF1769658.1 hypothetical protein GCK72_001475 [Caenorhabditis remanei]